MLAAAAAAVVAAVLAAVAGHTAAACIAAAAASALSCLFLYHPPFLCLTHMSPSARSNLRFSILSSQREGSFFGSHQFISVRVFSFKHGSHHHDYASTIIYSTNHQFCSTASRLLLECWIGYLPPKSSKIHKLGEHVGTGLEKLFEPSNSKNGNIINRSLNYSSEPLPFAARRSSSRRCCSNCFC